MELNRTLSGVLSLGVAFLLALLIGTITPATLRAQELFVETSTPAIGDSSVALETTVRFQFSAPLDTTARFSNGWPVAFFAIEPADSIRIDSMYFSADLRELAFDVTQTDDTEFIWLLTGAVAQDTLEFCHSFPLRYTTADTWPLHHVSGELHLVVPTAATRPCTGQYFYEQSPIAGLMTGDPTSAESKLVAAVTTDSRFGTFSIVVRNGTYWPVGLLDTDGNGEIEPRWDMLPSVFGEATYYERGDGTASSVQVADADVVNIWIMFSGPGSREQPDEIAGFVHGFIAYPNPTAGDLHVAYRVEAGVDVAVSVFDVLGREVGALVEESLHAPGPHEVEWRIEDVPSGIYFVRLQAAGRQLTRPVLVVR